MLRISQINPIKRGLAALFRTDILIWRKSFLKLGAWCRSWTLQSSRPQEPHWLTYYLWRHHAPCSSRNARWRQLCLGTGRAGIESSLCCTLNINLAETKTHLGQMNLYNPANLQDGCKPGLSLSDFMGTRIYGRICGPSFKLLSMVQACNAQCGNI